MHHRSGGNLPASTTTFIGRKSEIDDVRRQLGSARLVTLTGVGGVGKTRLAGQVADEIQRAFPDGIWLVDLAALQHSALVADHVAHTLGITDQTARWPVAVLSDYLSGKDLLLVLDNCEHLLDACAVFADALLKSAADLRILATSRQPLGLLGEQTVVVPPLAVPDSPSDAPVETLASYDAVRLFVTRAKAVLPEFRLTERNARVVAALCARLDGVPLAIELAAVRLRALSPDQILSRLDERFQLLTQGNRVALPRHQTLQGLVGWSYELCTVPEQSLWRQVSVFVGSFDLEAVENVCADENLPRQQLLDLVSGLVDKSVLLREEHDYSARYRLLDTIRDYGRQRLAGAGEQPLRRRHRDHYLTQAKHANLEWFSAHGPQWRERLRLDLPNVRAALDFCLSDPAEAESGMDLAATLAFGWRVLGLLREGQRWLDRLLATCTEPSPARAETLAVSGLLAILQGDVEAARALLEEGTRLTEQGGDTRCAAVEAYVALSSGLLAMAEGNISAAADLFEQAASDDDDATASALWRALGLLWLSMAASALGDTERAERCAVEYVSRCETYGAQWLSGFGHFALAAEYWRRGDTSSATEQARTTIQAVGDQDSISLAAATEVLAWVAAATGRPTRAALLLGALDESWRTIGAPLVGVPHLMPYREECEQRTRASLGEEQFVAATAQGARLDTQALIAYAMEAPQTAPGDEPSSPLTRREHEVAELVAAGQSNKKIASTLTISPRTAETHVDHILTKLGFTSRAQIAAWVTRNQHGGHA